MDAAILAGGRARRLGGLDKSALTVGQATIFERQLDALQGLADRILVVTGTPARYRDRGVETVADLVPDAGALGGIYTALTMAASSHVLVLACDLPFVRTSFLRRLVALAGPEVDIAIPRTRDGWQPLCAVYSRTLLEPVRRQIESGNLKIVDLLPAGRVREIGPDAIAEEDAEERMFLNVNSPADLARAVSLAGGTGGGRTRDR